MADSNSAQAIRESLAKNWQKVGLRTNCSGFLKQVASDLGVTTLTGRANDLIHIITTGWEWIPSAASAAKEAEKGSFVIALLSGPEHADHREEGHVAIVLPGALQARGSGVTGGAYPLVWCAGGKGGQSDGTRTVGDVWQPADRNKVKYYKYVLKTK